jgi:hypothetical protein
MKVFVIHVFPTLGAVFMFALLDFNLVNLFGSGICNFSEDIFLWKRHDL